MNPKIIQKEEFQVIGLKKDFAMYQDDNFKKEISSFWKVANEDGSTDKLLQLAKQKVLFGVCVDNDSFLQYWIGIEYEGDVPHPFESIKIPKSQWAVFEVHGAMPEAQTNVWEKLFVDWLPSSEYAHAGTPDLEVYPHEGNPYLPDYYSEIWIPIK